MHGCRKTIKQNKNIIKKKKEYIVKFETLRLIKLVAARYRRKRKLGENMALRWERYHLQRLCKTALIYRGKTDLVVTVSWKRLWIFNSVLIRVVEPLKVRGHMSANNLALRYITLFFFFLFLSHPKVSHRKVFFTSRSSLKYSTLHIYISLSRFFLFIPFSRKNNKELRFNLGRNKK